MGEFQDRVLAALSRAPGLIGLFFRALQNARSKLAQFVRNPAGFVIGTVLTLIANSVLNVGSFVVASVIEVFRIPIQSISLVTIRAAGALTFPFGQIELALQEIAGAYLSVITAAGPAAPLLGAATAAVLLVATWEIGKRVPGWLWKLYQLIPGT